MRWKKRLFQAHTVILSQTKKLNSKLPCRTTSSTWLRLLFPISTHFWQVSFAELHSQAGNGKKMSLIWTVRIRKIILMWLLIFTHQFNSQYCCFWVTFASPGQPVVGDHRTLSHSQPLLLLSSHQNRFPSFLEGWIRLDPTLWSSRQGVIAEEGKSILLKGN